MVGDSHTMGVAAQILEHILWASKGAFRVDHPVLSEERPYPSREYLWLGKQSQVSVETQLAILECSLKTSNELAAENATEHLDGKKESVMRSNPSRVIE